MVARLAGEQLASHDATVALGSVLGGPDLVRFYLSDNYQQLRDLLDGCGRLTLDAQRYMYAAKPRSGRTRSTANRAADAYGSLYGVWCNRQYRRYVAEVR